MQIEIFEENHYLLSISFCRILHNFVHIKNGSRKSQRTNSSNEMEDEE